MANWSALQRRLARADVLTFSWTELDDLVGGLPESAYKYGAFWSGNRSAWSGFRTRDVHVGQSVTFIRVRLAMPSNDARSATTPLVPSRARDSSSDIVVISCVKEKLDHAAPAKDLYLSPLFAKARAWAEASCKPWFILSAKHGLVDPDEVLDPYELRLSATTTTYRQAWGIRVVARLLELLGPLEGEVIEVHAGATYVEPIRDLLRSVGAEVTEPLMGLRQGERLTWYNAHSAKSNRSPREPDSTSVAPSDCLAMLRDQSSARTPAEFLATSGEGLRRPGLYSWWVDSRGASDLSLGLGHPVEAGLIYAGLAGATREISGKASSITLWHRIGRMHLGSRHGLSTLRRSLGSVMASALGWNEIDEAALSAWMETHLRVIAVPVDNADSLGRVESAVLGELDPPLNLSKVPTTEARRKLSALRRRYSDKRRRRASPDTNRPDI